MSDANCWPNASEPNPVIIFCLIHEGCRKQFAGTLIAQPIQLIYIYIDYIILFYFILYILCESRGMSNADCLPYGSEANPVIIFTLTHKGCQAQTAGRVIAQRIQ